MTKNVAVSAKNGMQFTFYHHGAEISYHCSPLSGKEVVKVNGKHVCETKNFTFNTIHQFQVNGKPAKITLHVQGVTKKTTVCEFFVCDERINAYRLIYGTQGKIPLMMQVIVSIIAAAIGWFYAAQFLSAWLAYGIVIVLLAAALYKFEKPSWRIEEL